MEQRRIHLSDIIRGEPLPWDVYGEGRKLLLRKGHVVENDHQIDELVERGLFIDAHQCDERHDSAHPAPAQVKELPSVLRLINLACKRLEKLLYSLHVESDATDKILEIAKALSYACHMNPDIAIGSILLNQENGHYAIRHSVDTALIGILVARAMKKPPAEIEIIAAAALTMNIGMLRQHDHLQIKQEPLSTHDTEIIRNHPTESVALLRHAGIVDEEWLACVLLHHENEDGSGYPSGKKHQDIPQNAEIVALADRYCARISNRLYRKSVLPNVALRDLFVEAPKTVDATLAPYFVQELGIYPPGTTVRLQSGEIAIVTKKGHTATTPGVHSIIGPRGVPLSFPIPRDTAREMHAVRDVLHVEQVALHISMQQLWGSEARL